MAMLGSAALCHVPKPKQNGSFYFFYPVNLNIEVKRVT